MAKRKSYKSYNKNKRGRGFKEVANKVFDIGSKVAGYAGKAYGVYKAVEPFVRPLLGYGMQKRGRGLPQIL